VEFEKSSYQLSAVSSQPLRTGNLKLKTEKINLAIRTDEFTTDEFKTHKLMN
jgi:hypothetical protein